MRVLLFLLIFSFFSFSVSAYTITGDLDDQLKQTILKYHEVLGETGIRALLEANNVNIYNISEAHLYVGKGVRIKSIKFNGNLAFLKSQLLNRIGIYENELYDSNELADAQQGIVDLYKSQGFKDVQVSYRSTDGHIIFDIIQGNRSVITRLDLKGADIDILPFLERNLLLNDSDVERLTEQVDFKLREAGYFNNKIAHDVVRNDLQGSYYDSEYPIQSLLSYLPHYHDSVTLVFEVEKGEKYTVDVMTDGGSEVVDLVKQLAAKYLLDINIFNVRNLENTIESEVSKLYYADPKVRIQVDGFHVQIHIEAGEKKALREVVVNYKSLKKNTYILDDQTVVNGEEEQFRYALELILKDHGYYDAKVILLASQEDRVVYQVDEGAIYTVGDSYIGEAVYPVDKGRNATKEGVQKSKSKLEKILGKQYYFEFLNIEKVVKRDGHIIDLYYQDNLNQMTYLDIVVNNSHLNKIIKRNFFSDNMAVTAEKILRTKKFLNSQDAISGYKFSLIPVSENTVIVTINVNYKDPNEFFGGVAYDSVNHLSFHLGYRRHNVFNLSHELELLAAHSFRETFTSLKLSGVGVLSDDLHDTAEIFYKDRDEDDFQYKQQRLLLSFGTNVNYFLLNGSTYLERIDIYKDRYTEEIRDVINNKFFNLGLLVGITYVNFDSVINPENGVAIKFQMNPVLSKEGGFLRHNLSGALYYTLWDKLITSARGEMGYINGEDDAIPLTYRFTLGGPYQMRAFDYRGIGSKDSFGHVYGGKSMYYGELAGNYKINEYMMLGAFYEIGQAEEKFDSESYQHDVGGLLSVRTPIGALKLSYAADLDDFNRRAFYITFGTQIP